MIIPVTVDGRLEGEDNGSPSDVAVDTVKRRQEETVIDRVPKWSMVELQGEIVSKDPLSGQPLGVMTLENVSVIHSLV